MNRPGLVAAAAACTSALVFYACTTTDRLGKQEPGFVTETLRSIVLVSGEEITFDQAGGKYSLLRNVIGTTRSGAHASIPQDEVMQARSWISPAVPPDSEPTWRCAEVVLVDSTVLMFTPPGGRFDAARRTIAGRTLRFSDTAYVNPRLVREYRGLEGTSANQALLAGDTTARFVELVLKHPQYKLVDFDSAGGRIGAPSEFVTGRSSTGTQVRVPLSSVLYGSVERVDAVRSILGVIAGTVIVAAVIVVIALATKQSCPFIYSFDGARYRFDAEPLGGATTEALARTDYSRLKYLRPVDGTYRLLLRNEVNETQYIDHMRLCVVDHDSSQVVIAAGDDAFHLLPPPASPIDARDGNNRNLLPFFARQDGIAWQTHMEGLPAVLDSVRETITLTYRKPPHARRAQFVVHGGTTQWGSNTIRLMYEMLGSDVDRWYDEVDSKGPELYHMLAYMKREELYMLGVEVRKNGGWVERGVINGGGPFICETQVIPLSVTGIEGDTLRIRIRPPVGFWQFDFAGVVFDTDSLCTVAGIRAASATDQDGRDVAPALEAADHRYFEMPTNREEATLTFAAPPEEPGKARTIFARTTGYYRLHLQKNHPPDYALIERLRSEQGAIVRYALERYREWAGSLRERLASGTGRP